MIAPNAAEVLNLVGFVTGSALYAMLLALVLRNDNPKGLSLQTLPLATAVLGLIWNLGELSAYALPKLGYFNQSIGLWAVSFPALGKGYVQWLMGRSKLNLDIDLATEVFQSLGSRPEPFRKALSQTRLQLAVNPAQDPDAMLASLAAKGVRDAKTDFLNTVASLPPLQSALLRELAADSLLGPDVRRPGIFSAAMKTRVLARLDAEMGAAHGVSVETPAVQNALDKLREENFLWRSQRGSYSVEDEQFLEWLVEEERGT